MKAGRPVQFASRKEIMPLEAVTRAAETAEQRLPARADIAPCTAFGERGGRTVRRLVFGNNAPHKLSLDILAVARANGKADIANRLTVTLSECVSCAGRDSYGPVSLGFGSYRCRQSLGSASNSTLVIAIPPLSGE